MRVTQQIEFECCYIAKKRLNAHRYKIEVTVSGEDRYTKDGIVIDFESLRSYIREVVPDNKFVLGKYGYESDAEEQKVYQVSRAMADCGIMTQQFSETSCEVICEEIAHQLQQEFYIREPGLIVEEVKLRENAQSYAVWTNTQNKSL